MAALSPRRGEGETPPRFKFIIIHRHSFTFIEIRHHRASAFVASDSRCSRHAI